MFQQRTIVPRQTLPTNVMERPLHQIYAIHHISKLKFRLIYGVRVLYQPLINLDKHTKVVYNVVIEW